MLVVIDAKTKKARLFDVKKVYSDLLYIEHLKNFSATLSAKITDELMETFEMTNPNLCIFKVDKDLFVLDCATKLCSPGDWGEIIPKNKSKFKEVFENVTDVFKKMVFEFDFIPAQMDVVDAPKVLNQVIVCEKENTLTVVEKADSKSEDFCEDLLQIYFSDENSKKIAYELHEEIRSDIVTTVISDSIGLYHMCFDGSHLCLKDKDRYAIIEEIIQTHLNGYDKYLEEITTRMYNYLIFGIAEWNNSRITKYDGKYMFTNIVVQGESYEFYTTLNGTYWVSAQPIEIKDPYNFFKNECSININNSDLLDSLINYLCETNLVLEELMGSEKKFSIVDATRVYTSPNGLTVREEQKLINNRIMSNDEMRSVIRNLNLLAYQGKGNDRQHMELRVDLYDISGCICSIDYFVHDDTSVESLFHELWAEFTAACSKEFKIENFTLRAVLRTNINGDD